MQNVGSEFIALGIILLAGWALYNRQSRGPLLEFFGIKRSKRLPVYLSNIRVREFGSTGVDGHPRSFGSTAIPAYEAALMPAIQRRFNFVVPGTEGLPGILKRLLISDVDVEINPAPLDISIVKRDAAFIAIGSPAYNLASMYVEGSLDSIGKFSEDMESLRLPGIPPVSDPRCAFVQRAGNLEQRAYYLAGISAQGTAGAVRFLLENWSDIRKEFPGDKPFCILIETRGSDGSGSKAISRHG